MIVELFDFRALVHIEHVFQCQPMKPERVGDLRQELRITEPGDVYPGNSLISTKSPYGIGPDIRVLDTGTVRIRENVDSGYLRSKRRYQCS